VWRAGHERAVVTVYQLTHWWHLLAAVAWLEEERRNREASWPLLFELLA
jgi:hypothetical protein